MIASPPVQRRVAAGRGVVWLSDGYALFKREPGVWVVIAVVWLVLVLASLTTSTFFSLAYNLVAPVISGGLMLGCDAQYRGERIRVEHLWAGFTGGRSGALITIGVFSLLGMVLVMLGGIATIGASLGGALLAGGGLESVELGLSTLLALLVVLLILTPVLMALWFAPALVAVHGVEPLPALKASFRACVLNIGSMAVNGLLMLLIAIAATIPLGLGWLVALPVITVSIYFSYRDIFVSDVVAPSAS